MLVELGRVRWDNLVFQDKFWVYAKNDKKNPQIR
jgi:hypothetical protein